MEIIELKEKAREAIPIEEVAELKGLLEKVKTDNRSLQSRLAQVQAALAEPSITVRSTPLMKTESSMSKVNPPLYNRMVQTPCTRDAILLFSREL